MPKLKTFFFLSFILFFSFFFKKENRNKSNNNKKTKLMKIKVKISPIIYSPGRNWMLTNRIV